MTDIALAPLTFGFTPLAVTFSSPTPVTPTPPGQATELQVFACTKYGSDRARTQIVTAAVQGVSWTLNQPAIAQFTVPWDDPNVGLLPTSVVPFDADDGLNHEVQIYRNGHLIFWGPVIARQGNTKNRVFTYIAKDPLWYLQSRFFGEANRRNYLVNGSFEDDPTTPTGWDTFSDGIGLSYSIDNVQFLLGTQSLLMQDETDNDAASIGQHIPISTGPEGLAVIATAWVFVDYLATGQFSDSGLTLQIRQSFAGTVLQATEAPIGYGDTARRQWVRLSCSLLIPPNQSVFIFVQLAADGLRWWDAVTVTTEESLSLIPLNSPDGNGWDQIDIAKMIVRYAEGSYPIGDPYTKSNLHIGVGGSASGIKKTKTYQFFDHQAVYQGGQGSGALDEFTAASDGFDVACVISPNSRQIKFYYPSVGKTWDADLFSYSRAVDVDGNLTGSSVRISYVDWSETIEGVADNVTILGGEGDGSGREEGGSFIGSFGDLTMELVESAPTGATIDLLNSIALARATQLGQPITTMAVTMFERRDEVTGVVDVPVIGAMMPGDLVPMSLSDGPLQVSETVRAIQVAYDASTETLVTQVQLNTPEGHNVPPQPVSQSHTQYRLHQRLYELERRILKFSFFIGEG